MFKNKEIVEFKMLADGKYQDDPVYAKVVGRELTEFGILYTLVDDSGNYLLARSDELHHIVIETDPF